MSSMLEYLAAIQPHGNIPLQIGHITIGRTVYSAGQYRTPERDAPTGSRAAREGQRIPSEIWIAMMPTLRTDWVTADSAGPTPPLLPATWKRNHNTVYMDTQHTPAVWYIAGHNTAENVLWLRQATDLDPAWTITHADMHWTESFETAIALASPAVLDRINAHLAETNLLKTGIARALADALDDGDDGDDGDVGWHRSARSSPGITYSFKG